MRETWVQSLGWEDLLEKGMATHSSILAPPSPQKRGSKKYWTSLVAQTVKSLPVVWKSWLQSLGREDLLEKAMATQSSILAWKIPWMEEPGGLQFMGSQRVRHD